MNILNKNIFGDFTSLSHLISDKSIDLILTSPPYDNLRTYNNKVLDNKNNFSFDFKKFSSEFYRILKVVVFWFGLLVTK